MRNCLAAFSHAPTFILSIAAEIGSTALVVERLSFFFFITFHIADLTALSIFYTAYNSPPTLKYGII
ncbi:hypothetical protein WS88_31020 [Burkholderia cepacia]|nr:hypothetical protein WS88_31020 [Burkholderia cepacia]